MEAMIRSVSPRDGQVKAEIASASREEVQAAVARCREAQAGWAARPLAERKAALERARRLFLERAEAIVSVLSEENGRPEGESWLSEIVPNGDLFSWWISQARRLLAPEKVALDRLTYPGKSASIEYVPRGVLALITPWNLPVAIPLRTLVPALLAGNGVVFKPSEWAARSGALLAEILNEALPAGVLEVVQGGGAVGEALVRSRIDGVFFTGSVATGRKVAEAAAAQLVPASLELGGKDAALVLADADLERAAQGIAWGGLFNAGQNCAAVERIYVEAPIAEAFTERLREVVASLRLGEDVGPLTTPFQLEIVERQMEEARAAGARVLLGGERPDRPGLWYAPTLLVLDTEEVSVLRDETFGPILPVRVVADADEAVRLANASPYGLTASVWTGNRDRGRAIARRLEAGVVTVNNHGFTGGIPALPWSGVKASGSGITSSHLALREMVRPRTVLVDRSKNPRELWWYPYNPRLVEIARALRDVALGKMLAFARLLKNLPKRFK